MDSGGVGSPRGIPQGSFRLGGQSPTVLLLGECTMSPMLKLPGGMPACGDPNTPEPILNYKLPLGAHLPPPNQVTDTLVRKQGLRLTQ